MFWEYRHSAYGGGAFFVDHRPTRRVKGLLREEATGLGWKDFVVRRSWKNPVPREERCNLCCACEGCLKWLWLQLEQGKSTSETRQ